MQSIIDDKTIRPAECYISICFNYLNKKKTQKINIQIQRIVP